MSERQSAGAASVGVGPRVLLVDDDQIGLTVVGRLLGHLGQAVETASDGAAALRLWQAGRHHLILTDCRMPVMDGFVLAQRIRALEDVRQTTIVALTGGVTEREQMRCIEAGMDGFLAKPVDLAALKRICESALT